MIATLEHYSQSGYILRAYVVMPDHLHLLLTPSETLERAVQLFKGGFSFRARKEFSWNNKIWQPGFTDHRIRDEEDWRHHLHYIRRNPVEARLVDNSVLYLHMNFPQPEFPPGLKPRTGDAADVRAEARTLQMLDQALPRLKTPAGTAEAIPFQSKSS
jgi:putative transposase